MLSVDDDVNVDADVACMLLVYGLCRYGIDYLELQFEFAMDLFPFYPPKVTVIRPRYVVLRVACNAYYSAHSFF